MSNDSLVTDGFEDSFLIDTVHFIRHFASDINLFYVFISIKR